MAHALHTSSTLLPAHVNEGLKGKTILWLNAGSVTEYFTLEVAKHHGCKIILVHKNKLIPSHLFDYVIEADPYDHEDVLDKVTRFLDEHPEVYPDGAVTFWEDAVPLLARICARFDLIGNSYEAAIRTRNKYQMRRRAAETGLRCPRFHLVRNEDDLREAVDKVGFPAVMKPAWGVDSYFVLLVTGYEEACAALDYLQKNCTAEFNQIFSYNHGMFLFEEYVEGTEVSVEAYTQYGIPQVVAINEKQPIKLPYFVEAGDICPARLTEDQILDCSKLAESALIALGVQNSLGHIEMKISPAGPVLIEVASRMGGDDIYRGVREAWGYDLIEMALLIATGQKVTFERTKSKGCVVCRYFIPESSGIITNISGIEEARSSENVVDIVIPLGVGDAVLAPPEGFDHMGWVVTKGRSYQEAESHLERVIKTVDLNVSSFRKKSPFGKALLKDALTSAPGLRTTILRAARMKRIRRAGSGDALDISVLINSPDANQEFDDGSFAAREVRDGLTELGHRVTIVPFVSHLEAIRDLQSARPDVVFNMCGEDAPAGVTGYQAATVLDLLALPYVGATSAALTLCADKVLTKKLFHYHEIPTPEWDCVFEEGEVIGTDLKYPLIVKPANTDNHFGISPNSLVWDREQLDKQVQFIFEVLRKPVLVEEYIEGSQYEVCLIGNKKDITVLPIIRSASPAPRMRTRRGSDNGHIQLQQPDKNSMRAARLPAKLSQLLTDLALDVYYLVDCLDYGKVEIRVDNNGNPYVLEVSPCPSLSPNGVMIFSSMLHKYTYKEFLQELVSVTVDRYKAVTRSESPARNESPARSESAAPNGNGSGQHSGGDGQPEHDKLEI